MKTFFTRTLGVFCLLTFTASVSSPAIAQGIGTTEYEMGYGREAFEAKRYSAATTYFMGALHLDPAHAEANYLLGVSHIKLGQLEKARPFLQKAAALDSQYEEEVRELLKQQDNSGFDKNLSPSKPVPKTPASQPKSIEYRIGDTVEVSYAGQWNPGRIVAVEGRGNSVFATVDFSFQGDKRKGKFFYNGLRRAQRQLPTTKNTKSKPAGNGLTLGEYSCSSKIRSGGRWVFTPRGSFRLLANGNYTQTNGGGRYKYNAAKKEITFIGGFFGNSKAKGKVISREQIDIHFTPNYWWTGALQK